MAFATRLCFEVDLNGADKLSSSSRLETFEIHCFNFESSCGIAGGMDYKALYFVGMINPDGADPKLMYLDPHFVQDAISSHRSKLWIDSLYIND